jgi:hypothetical protein
MNPDSTVNNWEQVSVLWNQTSDLTIPTTGNNLYTINSGSWDKGTWGFLDFGHLDTFVQTSGNSDSGYSLRFVGVFGYAGLEETYSKE